MKTFAIADIHGCYNELMALMEQLPIGPKDKVVFLGDYIDRGPDSKKVVEQLMQWEKEHDNWVFLYGNHEDLMLDVLLYKGRIYGSYHLWWNQGGKETAKSYIPEDFTDYEKALVQPEQVIPQEHVSWLASLARVHEDDYYIFVHAGLEPGKQAYECRPDTLIWIREEFIDSNYDWGKVVIFGHTAKPPKFEPIVMDNKIGIDTAVCPPSAHGLTAVELPTKKFYFQPAIGSKPS